MSINRFRILRLALLCAVCCGAAGAQVSKKSPLGLRLEPICPAPRSYAPILIDAGLDYEGNGLLEGTLQLRLAENKKQMLDIRIPDVFVSSPGYRTTIVLPPMRTPNSRLLEVRAKFILNNGEEIVLGTPTEDSEDSYLSLLVPQADQRGLTIGLVVKRAEDGKSAKQTFLGKALELQRHADQPQIWTNQVVKNRLTRKLADAKFGWFAASAPPVDPDLLPADPLALCAFDIVVLADGGLAELKRSQMTALKQWVKAGGSLCVVPDGQITRVHAGFVSDLLAEIPDPPAIAMDGTGRVIDEDNELLVMSRFGLGRVAVLPPNFMVGQGASDLLPAEDCFEAGHELSGTIFSKKQLRTINAFLWKIHSNLVNEPKWSFPTPPDADLDASMARRWGRPQRFSFESRFETATVGLANLDRTTSDIVDQLMPESVRMVPLWMVASMLLAYVFIVGPGDYLLLGLLKIRRYTWIVFPLVTALFTFGLVGISNYYMATSQTGGLIEIHDVVGKGEVVRTTKIDLEYYGARRELDEEKKATFVTPMRQIGALGESDATYSASGAVPYVAGRIPARYVSHRVVDQWSPQLSRSLSLATSKAPDLGFDWKKPGKIWTKAGQDRLRKLVRARQESMGVGVTLLSGQQTTEILPMRQGDSSTFRFDDARPYAYVNYMSQILKLSSPTPQRFFRYASHISPNGGDNFEDLAIHDPTDPNQWLLVASWFEGDTQKVYRRLYHRPVDSQEGRQ